MSEPRQLGNYTIGPRLGSGGSSEVYAGAHRFLGDPVAIKLVRVPPGADAVAADELLAEAARTRAIDHPNVVRVLDVGRDDASSAYYLVMERVDGEDLAVRLARVGRVDEAEARRLGAAIADGMAAAHDRGIVHRDLKPANVMLRGEQPTIVDFGIAKLLGDRAAVQTSRRIGTPAYMAPEQLTAGLISPAVDVWALGVMLFELVTGRRPFDGYDDGRCPQLFEAAPRAAASAPVSPAFDALVARCLSREPGLRPASMHELAGALRGGAEDRFTIDLGAVEPDASAPATVREPLPGTARRARVVVAIAGAAGVAGLVALTVALLRSADSAGASATAPQAAPPGVVIDAAMAPEPEPAIELEPAAVVDDDVDVDVAPTRSSTRRRAKRFDARPAPSRPDAEGLN